MGGSSNGLGGEVEYHRHSETGGHGGGGSVQVVASRVDEEKGTKHLNLGDAIGDRNYG